MYDEDMYTSQIFAGVHAIERVFWLTVFSADALIFPWYYSKGHSRAIFQTIFK